MGQKTWQSDFVTRQCPISHIKTGERHLEILWMYPSASTIIHWPIGIWISPLRINGTRVCRAAIQQFRISWKMVQRMFCRKTKTVFPARFSELTWKMPKVYKSRWPIFWINEKWNSLVNICFFTTKTNKDLCVYLVLLVYPVRGVIERELWEVL